MASGGAFAQQPAGGVPLHTFQRCAIRGAAGVGQCVTGGAQRVHPDLILARPVFLLQYRLQRTQHELVFQSLRACTRSAPRRISPGSPDCNMFR